jgi:REP element-mobilizing transposase RayT
MEENQAYFVTWATYNTRISEERYEAGMRLEEGIYLNDTERAIIWKFIMEKIKSENYFVETLNVLSDHCHAVLWCRDEDHLKCVIQDLKGYSSYCYSRQLKRSVAGGGRQNKIWAKSFSSTLLENERRFNYTVEYVRNNHLKHGLSEIECS